MRAVIQRVTQASVHIQANQYSAIEQGYLVLLGISSQDCEPDIDYMTDKIINLRIFPDQSGKINLSVVEKQYEILVVSQFTLYGDARKGRRPSFTQSAPPEKANLLYEKLIQRLKEKYQAGKIKSGVFREKMDVHLKNDGPFTILLDSERKF